MTSLQQLQEEVLASFDEKIKTYDKDGGFIVYVEDYDNQDFDCDLIKSFLTATIQKVLDAAERETSVKEKIASNYARETLLEAASLAVGWNTAIAKQARLWAAFRGKEI